MSTSQSSLIVVDAITKRFGGLTAVRDVSFSIDNGEIVGLIGSNGAGKTTLFEVMTGFQKPSSGKIFFNGHRIDGLRPDEIYQRGMVRTFQLVEPLRSFSVFNCVLLGAINKYSKTEAIRRTKEKLTEFGLQTKALLPLVQLPAAQQKVVELARALASDPKVVLADELAAGLTADEISVLMAQLDALNKQQGITFVLVEHVMHVITRLCQRVIVLDFGEKIAAGPPQEIAQNERVINAYLGK